ncbi:AcidPPc domain-containing protein [Aphelenchoides besseyi]|nr:AcidPPc domain-containing protein [Aphelenchoides besseyi]
MINWWNWSLTGRYVKQERRPTWYEVIRCAVLMATDISILFGITFALYSIVIWRAVSPSQVGFSCSDQTIRNPFHRNTVPTKLLLAVCLAGPLVVIGIASLLYYGKITTPASLIASIRYSTFSYLDYILSFWITTAILDYLKCHVSRLRPNFIEMCRPDALLICDSDPVAYVSNYTCTAHWKDARISQTSFPSGHSGASAFALMFVIYFFQRHLISKKIMENRYLAALRYVCFTFYSLFAIFCFVTRVTDFWHFPSDVCGGIGIAVVLTLDKMLTVDAAKEQFLELLHQLDVHELPQFRSFVTTAFDTLQKTEDNSEMRIEGRQKLRQLAKMLRKQVDVSGNKSQQILWPTEGAFDDCRPETTIEVDSFLYDENDLIKLQKSGRIKPSNFCADCKSTRIAETTYISHSYSIDELDYIFNDLLPQCIDLNQKRLVDIGSRLGAVVFAAVLFRAEIQSVVGIEISAEHCRLQEETLKFIDHSEKCRIVEGDFRDHIDIIQQADVVFMNNVFSFFVDKSTQVACWNQLHEVMKPETILVHNHSLEFVTNNLNLEFQIDEWVELIHPTHEEAQRMDVNEEAEHVICIYRIR